MPSPKKTKKTQVPKETKDTQEPPKEQTTHSKGWIPMRSAIVTISIVSIGMAILVASQIIPHGGWGNGILYGLLYGGMIWVIFLGLQLFYRFFRK
jgi:hypothetical protein